MHIEKLASKYHWFNIAEDGVVEMFLDHHSLSTFRMCEASFELKMMANIKGKFKSWNLEFGIIWHEAVEWFYVRSKNNEFELNQWLTDIVALWHKRDMDEQFSKHKMFIVLGGVKGLIVMAAQYAEHFAAEVDRLRVIGVEITFGKKREVPLGDFYNKMLYPVRCYLTGRIDFLMDSGSAIGPLDHKTTAFFKGNPANSYDPQEGMTGYVFASQAIIKTQFPEFLSARKIDRIWMNFAQITPQANPLERFRRIPVFKTEWQLEQYRSRQLRTFHKIYDMLVNEETPDWNTSVCNNMFHTECEFRNLHRQNAGSSMFNVLEQDFIIAPAWNPETVDEERKNNESRS